MRTIVDYIVADGGNPLELQNNVNAAIQDGWTPIGGVSAGTYSLFQAMVKYEDKLPEPSDRVRGLDKND